jgi:hypothetical protein
MVHYHFQTIQWMSPILNWRNPAHISTPSHPISFRFILRLSYLRLHLPSELHIQQEFRFIFFFLMALQPQFGPWPTSMKLSVSLQFTRSCMYCMYVWGVGFYSPCTLTHSGLLCLTPMIDEDDFWSNWWNENRQGKPTCLEKTYPSATLSTTKSHMTDPVSNPGPQRWEASD